MYSFFINHTLLPVPPGKMQTKIGNENKTVTLINDGEINILKSPGLTEISFDILLPNSGYHTRLFDEGDEETYRGGYPFARYDDGFKPALYYLNMLKELKLALKPFWFDVYRSRPNGAQLYTTGMLVSLEDYTVTEDAKDGFDVTVSIKLKQYRNYAPKVITIAEDNGVSVATVTEERETSGAPEARSHTVVKGDCLWNIAKKYFGDGTRYKELAQINNIKNPNLIYPGQVIKLE